MFKALAMSFRAVLMAAVERTRHELAQQSLSEEGAGARLRILEIRESVM